MSEIKEDDYNLDFRNMGGPLNIPSKPFTPGRSVSPGSGFAITNSALKNNDSPTSNYYQNAHQRGGGSRGSQPNVKTPTKKDGYNWKQINSAVKENKAKNEY